MQNTSSSSSSSVFVLLYPLFTFSTRALPLTVHSSVWKPPKAFPAALVSLRLTLCSRHAAYMLWQEFITKEQEDQDTLNQLVALSGSLFRLSVCSESIYGGYHLFCILSMTYLCLKRKINMEVMVIHNEHKINFQLKSYAIIYSSV